MLLPVHVTILVQIRKYGSCSQGKKVQKVPFTHSFNGEHSSYI